MDSVGGFGGWVSGTVGSIDGLREAEERRGPLADTLCKLISSA